MRLYELEKYEFKLFCDLDGVLADFNTGMADLLDETEPPTKNIWKALHQLSHEEAKNWWANLPMLPGAEKLWSEISEFYPTILSSPDLRPGFREACVKGKKEWVRKHLTPFPSAVIVNPNKEQYAAPHHILIDDREKILKPWIDHGGIGILHINVEQTLVELNAIISGGKE